MNVHFAGRFAALLLFASLCTNVLAQPLLERAKTNVSSLQLVSDDISEYVNEIFKKPETTDEESSLADSLTRIQNWVI